MFFSGILSKLYSKIYISIVVSISKTYVCVEISNGNKLIKTDQKIFNHNKVTNEIISFINEYKKESPFFYISLLDYSTEQSAFDEHNIIKDNESDISTVHHSTWSSFTLKKSIKLMQQTYSSVGLDFIFSPLTILSNIFSQKIQENKAKLFILFQEDIVVISIFNNNKLKYADIVDMKIKLDETIEDEEDIETIEDEDSIDFEDIDLDSLDTENDLNELSNLKDLDDSESFDDLEDFTETDIKKNGVEDIVKENIDDIANSTQDYKQFLIIQNALHYFYMDKKYDSEFIEIAYIATNCFKESQLKQYLEEELFLKVYIREVNLCQELISLAKREV